MGNRVLKYNNTTARKYIVDIAGGLPTILHELDPNNGMEVKRYYIYANGEVLMKYEPYDRYFYLHDRLGSVRQIIQYNRSAYAYGPFGEMLESECVETTENPFKFTGQYYDSEIGQYYLRARQYDPQLMRFSTRDSVDGKFEETLSLHKYLYCQNEPINRTDPSGLTIIDAFEWYNVALGAASYGITYDDLRFLDLAVYMFEALPAMYSMGGGGLAFYGMAGGVGGNAFVFNANQDALIQLARNVERTGISVEDAMTMLEWADEYGIIGRNDINTTHWVHGPHINIHNMYIRVLFVTKLL